MSTNSTAGAATLLDLLEQRAAVYGDKLALNFSYNGDGENASELTYRELATRAKTIAAALQERGAVGERALVLCRPGLDCIAAYFGCIYAGVVAVPVHERLAPRLSLVAPDARARFVLGTSQTSAKVQEALADVGEGQELQWILTDQAVGDGAAWVRPDIASETTAMIQYTSGSTTAPKGVLVSHGNLIHNMECIRQAWNGDDTAVGVFWLPVHHDMGLIGGILSMLNIGSSAYLMSPTAFIKKPSRWLEALSARRATFTVAPNFAYDACVAHTSPQERAALDLSRLHTAMNGAEPVRAATMETFAEAFAPAGFRLDSFMPVYGLAEATLLVTGGSTATRPVVHHIDRDALIRDRVESVANGDPSAVTLVGCGLPRGDQRVAIVDPVSRRRCKSGEVGEVWIAGPCVGAGYWDRPAESEHIFAATSSDESGGPYLRTGDLGFFRGSELFITGRFKDLVTIRGNNHYPNDIEMTVQECHPALASGRGAVFAITPGLGAVEKLIIVQEWDDTASGSAKLPDILRKVDSAVRERHGIEPHSVFFVEHLSIPTTSSGKIQRGLCRQNYLDGQLRSVAVRQPRTALEDAVKAREFDTAVAAAEVIKATLARQQASGER